MTDDRASAPPLPGGGRDAAGPASPFADIVREYKNRVAALGRGFFKNACDTEDFVQDVFLKVFTALKTFRGESRFSTWLTRIAYTTALNAVNRRKTYESIADEEALPDGADTPEEACIRGESCAALRAAVRGLPEAHALCVDLFFFHGMPHKEISRVTGLPVNTVKSHIFRAKKALREKLLEAGCV